MSQKLLGARNPFQTAESFVKKIRTEVYGKPSSSEGKQQLLNSSQPTNVCQPKIQQRAVPTKPTKKYQPNKREMPNILSQYSYKQSSEPDQLFKNVKPATPPVPPQPKPQQAKTSTQYPSSQNNCPSQSFSSVDRHLTEFLKDNDNLMMIMQIVGTNPGLISRKNEDHQQVKQFNEKEPGHQLRHDDQQPFDFDALREEEFQDEKQALLFIPQLRLPAQTPPKASSELPSIVTEPIPCPLFLDLKFNVQMEINKRSFKDATRAFLTAEQTFKTKKYILSE